MAYMNTYSKRQALITLIDTRLIFLGFSKDGNIFTLVRGDKVRIYDMALVRFLINVSIYTVTVSR